MLEDDIFTGELRKPTVHKCFEARRNFRIDRPVSEGLNGTFLFDLAPGVACPLLTAVFLAQ